MAEFLFEYGLFLAKALTIVAAVGAIALLVVGMSRRGHSAAGLEVEKLNDQYRERSRKLRAALLPKPPWQGAQTRKAARQGSRQGGGESR